MSMVEKSWNSSDYEHWRMWNYKTQVRGWYVLRNSHLSNLNDFCISWPYPLVAFVGRDPSGRCSYIKKTIETIDSLRDYSFIGTEMMSVFAQLWKEPSLAIYVYLFIIQFIAINKMVQISAISQSVIDCSSTSSLCNAFTIVAWTWN